MKPRVLAHSILAVSGAWALLYVVRFALPPGTLDSVVSELLMLKVGTTIRCVALAVAAVFAFSSAHRLGDSPSRLPWAALAVGLAGFALGQGSLAWHQLRTGETPFPSIADVFFLGGYPFILAAFVLAIRAYHLAGLPIGAPRDHALLGLGSLVTVLLVGTPLLKPILAAPATPLVRALNVAYPALDFVAFIPILVLVRITARFAGGQVATVWASLLTGFIFLGVADAAFAYFQVLGQTALDPILYAAFLFAYGFIARGAILQHELLTR